MNRLVTTCILAAITPVAWSAWVESESDYGVSAAHGPYFACDKRVVEDRWLVERFIVPPQRYANNPVVTREFPWEGTGPHLGGSVLVDPEDGLFKMWYTVWNKEAYYNHLPFSYNVCYAESDDGLQWRKPKLGVFEYESERENNCIKLGLDKTQNIDVCLNPIPDKIPGKFLAIHNQKGGVFVSTSDDGKSFRIVWDRPAIAYHSDTHNNFVYDDVRNRWLLYCRPRAYAGYHKRRVSLQKSTDLEHWTHERTILVPAENEIPEYYGMTVFRHGDLFFGMLQIYDRLTGYMHTELAWSGDGKDWEQIPTHPVFFDRGPQGSWDAGMVLVGESPVSHDDELWFYYGGFPLDHNTKEENVGGIGLMICERDRLIGVRPNSAEPGYLLTRPIARKEEMHLTVNAVIENELRAELRTDHNKPITGFTLDECDPIQDSGFAMEITWKGNSLNAVPEQEFRILFRLDSAQLFTFDF